MREERSCSLLPASIPLRLLQVAVAGILCLLTLAAFPPVRALAQEEGCGCHSEESAAWEDSMHHQAVVASGELSGPACEDCHGSYVRGHPAEGVMSLEAGSALCGDCHTETYAAWEDTYHAQQNVQCTGCHLVHSQTLRLTPDELCASCHKTADADSFHVAHRSSEVACTQCHLFPTLETEPVTGLAGSAVASRHDFMAVDASACIDCHVVEGPDGAAPAGTDEQVTELMMVANRVPALTAKLEAVQKENTSLASVSYAALGLGIGVGAILGMILVLVVGYVSQREES